jgi:hypothetical protein
MASPLGAGDILALGDKALQVYKSYKGAPASFASIAQETYSMHAILKQVEEFVRHTPLSAAQADRLSVICEGCVAVLAELAALVHKYADLAGPRPQAWHRVRYGGEDVAGLRARLVSNTMALSAFKSCVHLLHWS